MHKVADWWIVLVAQIFLSAIFITGYFVLLIAFIKGDVHVPGEYHDSFQVLLGVLTAGVGMILSYWFQRQRDSAPGAPGAQQGQPQPQGAQ